MQHINCFQRILLHFQLLTRKTVLDSYKQMGNLPVLLTRKTVLDSYKQMVIFLFC